MTYEYGRYHEDGLGEYNYQFMPKGDKVLQITSCQFNWTKEKRLLCSYGKMQRAGPVITDVFAGLELQQGGSYKTKSEMGCPFDENGKTSPVTWSLAPGYYYKSWPRQEKIITRMKHLLLGYQQEIQLVKTRRDKDWYRITSLVADRTPSSGT